MSTTTILAIIAGLLVVAGVVYLFVNKGSGSSNAVSAAAPTPQAGGNDVDELTDEEDALGQDALVFFGSNGCPACRAFKPMYYRAAGAYPRRFRYMDLARLKNRAFLKRHNIRAIPHVVAVKGGKVKSVFGGKRSVENLRAFAKKNL